MHSERGGRRIPRFLVGVAVLAAVAVPGAPRAAIAGAQDDMNKYQQQLNDINQKKAQATNQLQRLNLEAESAETQKNLVDQEYADAKAALDVINTQVATTTNELKKVEANLKDAEQKYQVRKTALSARLRALNEEGRVNYLGVLFGSSSFADFIGRFDMLKLVVKQDSNLFAQVKDDKQKLEVQRQDVATRQTQLLGLQASAKDRETQVASRRAEQEQVSRSLDTRIADLKAQLDAYDAAAQEVNDKVWQLQQAQNRPRNGKFDPIPPVKHIIITDVFGPRMHPILHEWRQHYGTDFAADTGDPVYAIEDGTVIVAGWNDAYGNLVVIDHGGGYASWYGHASKLLVRVGDTVKRGQQITQAGSTGWATGPHVHLEIHVNGTPVDPMTYLQ
jgi:murein DD-endopeptidase MepM/ murein hydrolase activator NlpD